MKPLSIPNSIRLFFAVFGLIFLVSQIGCYSSGANSSLSGFTPFQPRSFSHQVGQQQNYQPLTVGFQPQAQQQSFQVQSFQGQPFSGRAPQQTYANQSRGNQVGFGFSNPFARQQNANQVGFRGTLNPFGFGKC